MTDGGLDSRPSPEPVAPGRDLPCDASGKTADRAPLTVFHDGSCPLCRREIAFFRQRVAEEDVRFVDVSEEPSGLRDFGLDRERAMARFHVETGGRMLSGAAAFAALWRVTPGLRLLGRVAGVAPVTAVLERVYRGFLRVRPALQRAVRQ